MISPLLGLNPVSVEPRHESASFGANPIAIDQELNSFEGSLSPKNCQPPQLHGAAVLCGGRKPAIKPAFVPV
jgi:hypothetical protein